MATVGIIATVLPAKTPQESSQVVSSFTNYIATFMASYKVDRRERVSKSSWGWTKEYYEPSGEPNIDVMRTDSLVSPYLGICEFNLVRHRTGFHSTRADATQDNTFVASDMAQHRHQYAYQNAKWVQKTREYFSNAGGKWYDCNEVGRGDNAGTTNLFGCWETN